MNHETPEKHERNRVKEGSAWLLGQVLSASNRWFQKTFVYFVYFVVNNPG